MMNESKRAFLLQFLQTNWRTIYPGEDMPPSIERLKLFIDSAPMAQALAASTFNLDGSISRINEKRLPEHIRPAWQEFSQGGTAAPLVDRTRRAATGNDAPETIESPATRGNGHQPPEEPHIRPATETAPGAGAAAAGATGDQGARPANETAQEEQAPIVTAWRNINAIFRINDGADSLVANGEHPALNGQTNGLAPIDEHSIAFVSIRFGGIERDPRFLTAVEKLAGDNGFQSVEEFLSHQGTVRSNAVKDPSTGQGVEMPLRAALYQELKAHSAFMKLTDLAHNPLPLTYMAMEKQDMIERGRNRVRDALPESLGRNFVRNTTGEAEHLSEQMRYGGNMVLRDQINAGTSQAAPGNWYVDNGQGVKVYLAEGQTYNAAVAMNQMGLHVANRNKMPRENGEPNVIQFNIKTGTWLRRTASMARGKDGQHAFMRDMGIIAALQSCEDVNAQTGGRQSVLPEISVYTGVYQRESVTRLKYEDMSPGAVAQMEMRGIKVKDLVDRFNALHEDTLSVDGGPATPRRAEPVADAQVRTDPDTGPQTPPSPERQRTPGNINDILGGGGRQRDRAAAGNDIVVPGEQDQPARVPVARSARVAEPVRQPATRPPVPPSA